MTLIDQLRDAALKRRQNYENGLDDPGCEQATSLLDRAADEIERLQAENATLLKQVEVSKEMTPEQVKEWCRVNNYYYGFPGPAGEK